MVSDKGQDSFDTIRPEAPVASLCRDCDTQIADPGPRCTTCGSPRLIAHSELPDLAIAHIDCDAFFAMIEKRDRPELADVPVIVGGGRRGVVSTCCYLARTYGVHSAMPMFKALRACPDAVVLRPDMAKYTAVADDIQRRMRALTPLVQPLSIDEAHLDLRGTERLHGRSPAAVLSRFAREVEEQLGLTVSIGLSHNRFLAKIASEMDKPHGFAVIGRSEAQRVLAELPVTAIWGIGRKFQARLARDGITRVAQVQVLDRRTLVERYGSMGLRLHDLSHAVDHRPVDPKAERKSVSAETTFARDLSEPHEMLPLLRRLSEKVSRRLKDKRLAGRTVVLKLKCADFQQRTRHQRLSDPTQLADRIFRTGRALLEPEMVDAPFRLIGIGVTDLDSADQADPIDLVDEKGLRRAGAEHAIDAIRARFGNDGVKLGLMLDRRSGPDGRENR